MPSPLAARRHRRCVGAGRSLPAVLAVALLAVGCGSGLGGSDVEDDPAAALQGAVSAVADWEGITAALRLELHDDARSAALAEADDELSESDLDLLLDSKVTMTAAGTSDPGTGSFETSIIVGGDPVVDLRVLAEQQVFVRVDLPRITELGESTDLGEDADLAADLEELVVAARMFGLGDAAQAAVDGRWIEVIGIDDAMELAGVETESNDPQVDEEELEALTERVAVLTQRFVEDDVTVTYVGPEDRGDRVRMETDGASAEAFLDELVAEVDGDGLVDGVTGQDAADLDIDPDTVIAIDAWIDGGELTQIAVDLGAMEADDGISGEVLLVMELEEFTGTLAAPDDAEPFDILTLVGSFFGAMGGDAFGGEAPDLGDLDDPGDTGDASDPGDTGDASDPGGGQAPDCISEEDLAEVEEFAGAEATAELRSMIESGLIERC